MLKQDKTIRLLNLAIIVLFILLILAIALLVTTFNEQSQIESYMTQLKTLL
jgi:hypothetical protein